MKRLLAGLLLALILTGCTDAFSDEGPMNCLADFRQDPQDQSCPTPPPMADIALGLNEEGFVPAADVRPMCEALVIVDEVIQPAFAEFEDSSIYDDPDAVAAVGDRIIAAGVEIERLAGRAGPEVVPYVEKLGRGFQEEGRRASEGDLSKATTRQSIGGLLRRFDSACFGLRPENRAVTRAALASVIADQFALPETSEDFFTDDDESAVEDAINRAAAAGVLNGCGDSKFCPDEPTTRGMMAVVLVRALDLPPTDDDYFTDDDGSPFEPFINRIAAAGIATGQRSGGYRPDDGLQRRQIDDFLKHVERLNR